MDAAPSAVSSTAPRALALGTALTTPSALRGLRDDLEAIGIVKLPKR